MSTTKRGLLKTQEMCVDGKSMRCKHLLEIAKCMFACMSKGGFGGFHPHSMCRPLVCLLRKNAVALRTGTFSRSVELDNERRVYMVLSPMDFWLSTVFDYKVFIGGGTTKVLCSARWNTTVYIAEHHGPLNGYLPTLCEAVCKTRFELATARERV